MRVSAAEYCIAPKTVCIFGPNARRTRAEAAPGGGLFHANALMIPTHKLRDLVNASPNPGDGWPGLPDSLPLSTGSPAVRRLSGLLDFITGQLDENAPPSDRSGAAMAVLIEEYLSDLILRARPEVREEERVLPGAFARVRKAEEVMRARSDEPLSMAAMGREVGVGLRSLQLAFIEVRAKEPQDVLRRIRLERARECLLAAGPAENVTTIALDCGFAHLGRFPAAYRTAFGEVPAETLARSHRRRA